MVERRIYEANRPRVNVTKNVTTYHLIRWADIGTGGTPDTAQGILELRQLAHTSSSVIEQHNMHFFIWFGWPTQESAIRSNWLGGSGTGQQTQLQHRRRVIRQQLFNSGQDYVYSW